VEVTVDGRRLNTRGAGELFGEMALLSGRDFHRFLRRYPDIRAQIAALAAQRDEGSRQDVVQ
jgi:hypothetical protein